MATTLRRVAVRRPRIPKFRIIPYRGGSESARLLATAIGERVQYKVWRGAARPGAINIQWGKPGHPATDKLQTFDLLRAANVSHVPYTRSKEEAEGWLAQGSTVFARTTNGQGGSGITIVQPPARTLPTLPLYTQYVKKKKEFRVHVLNGEVIDVQQKKKRNGVETTGLIRNLENGWIFAHEDVVEPNGLRELGVAAVRAVGLDFGAVDVIWNERANQCYVLEVNTAPGLCETTAGKYADAFVRNHAQAGT